MRAAAFLMLIAGCNTAPYCLDCQKQTQESSQDGGSFDGGGGGGDGGGCVPSAEICNGKDDDCDGVIDNPPLSDTGGSCGSSIGTCVPGTVECDNGKLACTGGVLAQGEICNGLDDDCDGTVDNGNPGGGVFCGNGTGACVQGTTICMDGAIQCMGGSGPTPEICDGVDNDCDGQIDNGDPGGGASCGAAPGVCVLGTVHCSGGELVCLGAMPPVPEICNGIDDNCNGLVDEGFDTATDINNCGACNHACNLADAAARCAAGVCEISSCAPNFWDLNNDPSDGCEYACTFRGVELCNGIDDDCDGVIDNHLPSPAPDICLKQGECAGTVASCDGTSGYQCHYGATVSTNSIGQIIPETDCDNLDNDCNGKIDDLFPNRGKGCTKGLGACTTNGTQICNPTHDGLICNAPSPSPGKPEVCNGIDDDCDGVLDNGAPDLWVGVNVGGVTKQVYQYEASRPDATGTLQGSLTHRSCSAAARLPWVNVTYPQAVAACAAAGARLCTETEWQAACQAPATTCDWSFASGCTSYTQLICNDANRDSDLVRPGIQNGVLPTGAMAACYADWAGAGHIFDLSGNVQEWAQARAPGVNPLRGGAYSNPSGGTRCDASFALGDDGFLYADVGFRCCKD